MGVILKVPISKNSYLINALNRLRSLLSTPLPQKGKGKRRKKERLAHFSPPALINLPPAASHMLILKHMMLQHPAALILLVQEIQRLPVEREVRVVDVHRRLPAARVEIPATATCVCLWTGGGDEDDAVLFFGRGRSHFVSDVM
jgi:hypothetical protein